jgi:hypothetical protein
MSCFPFIIVLIYYIDVLRALHQRNSKMQTDPHVSSTGTKVSRKHKKFSPSLQKILGVWQGVAMDALQFHPGPPCLTVLHPADRPPLTAVSGVARPQSGWPAAVFYLFGHPTPYTYACKRWSRIGKHFERRFTQRRAQSHKMGPKWDWFWIVYPRRHPTPTLLCPAGDHPRSSLMAGPGMASCKESFLPIFLSLWNGEWSRRTSTFGTPWTVD